jgi:ectoine hydroxylase-related dioxygenase (phytanoyl-CoA dioxygenase family)
MTVPANVPAPPLIAFGPGDLNEAVQYYREFGFAVLRGAISPHDLRSLEAECERAQERLVAGELGEEYGTTELIEANADHKARHFANYVLRITELSPTARDITRSPAVTDFVVAAHGSGIWSGDDDRHGYVYQDARPSAESSYKRIGWHSDWQSAPHFDMWPSTAVTINVDETGPLNGFLRVVPGSHLWATPAPYENVNGAVVPDGAASAGGCTDRPPPFPMPLRFEKIPGEVALYADAGDIFFHDCYLWHSAAMATDPSARRRHVRGSWYAGARPASYGPDDFVKNAAR